MNPKNQTNAGVFPSDVGLIALLLDVSISQLEDSCTVDPAGCKATHMEQ